MKMNIKVSMAAVAALAIVGCTKVDEFANNTNPLPMPEQVAASVQGLSITPKNSYVVVGEEVSLSLTAQPEDARIENVSWESSDLSVATVDGQGLVKTVGRGIARITASVAGAKVTAIVNVYAERIPATGIQINKTAASIRVGQFTQLRASLLPDGSEEGVPGTTDRLDVEWISSNPDVATVDYGLVRALSAGSTTITAKQGDLAQQCEVTVNPKVELVDKSAAWEVTDVPHWSRDSWSGKINGSYEDVTLSGCDAPYHVFAVVEAEKFTSIEELAADAFLAVDEAVEAGKDPASLFATGETGSIRYNELGDATAYVLGFGEDFDFTGDYVKYDFTARTPDPVHATGVQFQGQSGWDYADISSLEIREGKSTRVQLKLLPADCTDFGSISLEAEDASILKVEAYYPQYYENQFTVTAMAAGSTKLLAKFNDVVSELEVTVTGSNIVLTDHSSTWKATKTTQEQYGWTVVNITVSACDAERFYATVMSEKPQDAELKATLSAMADGVDSYYMQSEVPAEFQSWGSDGRYIVILGFNQSGDFTGDYAIIDSEGSGEPGGDDPTPDPEGNKRIKFGDVVFRAELPASRSTSDEGTLEAWIYVTSTGGCQNIAGSEANFLLRIDSNQLDFVYGGAIDNRGEVGEEHVRADVTTNAWHHVVATYTRNDKAILYVDGESVGSGTTLDHPVYMDGKTKNDGAYPCWGYPFRFYIGSGSDKHNYSGSLAYLRVYDRAVQAGEISDLMYEEDVDDNALIGYWKFNEGSGNQIADYSGNGITLTARKALTGNASGAEPVLEDGTVTWEAGELPY